MPCQKASLSAFPDHGPAAGIGQPEIDSVNRNHKTACCHDASAYIHFAEQCDCFACSRYRGSHGSALVIEN